MDHLSQEDGHAGSDAMSGASDESLVWPMSGGAMASPTRESTSHVSAPEAEVVTHPLGPPPPLPPRDTHRSLDDELPGSTETLNGHSIHDEQQHAAPPTRDEIWITTLPRRILLYTCSVMCLVSVVFLVVAHSGSTRATKTSMNIYFFRMDLSYIFDNQTAAADGTANPALASTISQSIGLHDYYQAGLWGFCQGYYASGLTSCSRPRAFYWFNPLGILLDEMLLRSTLDIPPRAATVLEVVRVSSQAMFGLYLFGAVLALVLALASPLALFSRWYSLPVTVLAGATAAPLMLASSIATILAVAYRVVAASITQLNIVVTVGPAMFVMVWAAAGLSAAAFLAHATLGCCGTSVRDVETGLRPFVRLPPDREARNGALSAKPDDEDTHKKAGAASFVPWANVFVLKKNKKKGKKDQTAKPAASPPRPAPAPFLSALAMHPITPIRHGQGVEDARGG